MRRYPVRQFQERPEPVEFGFPECGYIFPIVRATNRRTDGNHQNVQQPM